MMDILIKFIMFIGLMNRVCKYKSECRAIKGFFILLTFCNFYSLNSSENLKPIGIIYDARYRGEKAFANRFKISASKQNLIVNLIEVPDAMGTVIEDEYEFIILLTPVRYLKADCPKYLLSFLPDRNFFDNQQNLLNQYMSFDGFLFGFESGKFSEYLFSIPNGSSTLFNFFPTCSSYNDIPSKPNKIFWPNAAWGSRIDDIKYQNLFRFLANKKIIDIYGVPTSAIKTISLLPFDDLSFFEKMSGCGISLVIHSDIHRRLGIPTCRIFEALACSNLIICDKHPFVEKIFGENILYINTDLPWKDIAFQIKKHLIWASKNIPTANKMSKNSHEIFLKSFNLEDQIKKLIKFHENIISKREGIDHS